MSNIRLWIPRSDEFEVDEQITEESGHIREFCTIESHYAAYHIKVNIERIYKHNLPYDYHFISATKMTNNGIESPINPNDITWYKNRQDWLDYGCHYYVHHDPLFDVFTHHEVAQTMGVTPEYIKEKCETGSINHCRKAGDIWLISWDSCSHLISDLDILGASYIQKPE